MRGNPQFMPGLFVLLVSLFFNVYKFSKQRKVNLKGAAGYMSGLTNL